MVDLEDNKIKFPILYLVSNLAIFALGAFKFIFSGSGGGLSPTFTGFIVALLFNLPITIGNLIFNILNNKIINTEVADISFALIIVLLVWMGIKLKELE